jgi:hypothetical protein
MVQQQHFFHCASSHLHPPLAGCAGSGEERKIRDCGPRADGKGTPDYGGVGNPCWCPRQSGSRRSELGSSNGPSSAKMRAGVNDGVVRACDERPRTPN